MPILARNRRAAGASLALACVLLFTLFEVRLRPEFSWPREVERPEPTQEARYERCVDELTDRATRRAFETADNPDVQSLMIRMEQKEAIARCRAEYPERRIVVSEPLRLNLVDISWRFSRQ